MSTSAFGVEHISKSLPSALRYAMRNPETYKASNNARYSERLMNAKAVGSLVPHLKDSKTKAAAIRIGRSEKYSARSGRKVKPSPDDERLLGRTEPPKSWKGYK